MSRPKGPQSFRAISLQGQEFQVYGFGVYVFRVEDFKKVLRSFCSPKMAPVFPIPSTLRLLCKASEVLLALMIRAVDTIGGHSSSLNRP